jgi:N-sulfoglucosamine sulfohydrolase
LETLRLRGGLVLLNGFVCALGFAQTGQAAEKNIILIVIDDGGPTFGCYGDTVARTPAIDALAADGMVFRNAFATTASCSASRSVLLSGLHNHKNGQFGHQHDFHKFTSFDNVASLALPRVLSQAGYRTAQIGKYHVGPEFVYHFDQYLPGAERNPVQMAENCRDLISAQSDKPFFLYFATGDPHRGAGTDPTSTLKFQPNLFGNKANRGSYPSINEQFFEPDQVIVPAFLTDTPETRGELAQYYQSISRIDQGIAKLVEVLRSSDMYDKTMIVFTSDHGMAFAGAKTTVYEAGLRVPFIVRNPYSQQRGVQTQALVSHIDVTPSLLDFAGGLDTEKNAPTKIIAAVDILDQGSRNNRDNHSGPFKFDRYHGESWMSVLDDPTSNHWDTIVASHTFHEIQMYYPMRAIRDTKYKLIWNIAHPLPFPFASDLWAAASWQAQYQQGLDARYGQKTVGEYIQRPEFELYDMQSDPNEAKNLAKDPAFADTLEAYKKKLRDKQAELEDPWITKWDYE